MRFTILFGSPRPRGNTAALVAPFLDECARLGAETEQIGLEEEWQVPNLTESVSEDAEGKLHITVTNLSASESYPIDAVLVEYPVGTVSGEIVSGDMHEKNTFEAPDCVQVRSFDGVSVTEKGLSFTIPPCAVVHLTVTRKA